jgi:hypothetical protein
MEQLGIKREDWENIEFVIGQSLQIAGTKGVGNNFEGTLYVGGRECWLEWLGDEAEYEISWLAGEDQECGLVLRFGKDGELDWVEYMGLEEEDEAGVNSELLGMLVALNNVRQGGYGLRIKVVGENEGLTENDEPELGEADMALLERFEIYPKGEEFIQLGFHVMRVNLN